MAELQLLVDSVVVNTFPLNNNKITIGRTKNNDIVIDEEAVSSEHARIIMTPNEHMEGVIDIFIEDLNSTNGTFVNEERVKRKQLHNSDYIRIAWTKFKLVSDQDTDIEETSVIAH